MLPKTITAAQCRELSSEFKQRARQAGISDARANLLKNISRSFSALANQLEMLTADIAREKRQ
jgi:hypothetical protein